MSNKPFPFSVCKDCCATGSGVDNDYINNNFANAVKRTLKYLGSRVELDDVSTVEHIVKIKILSTESTVENTKVYVTDANGEVTEYIPNLDGSVDVLSVAPIMRLFVESTREYDSVIFQEIEYNQDINKALSQQAELIETINADGTMKVYERSKDLNGNDYDFKAMYIHIARKPTVNNRIEVHFYTRGLMRLCSYLFTNTAGNNGFMSIHADVIGGMWQAIATSATSQGAPTAVQMWGENLIPFGGERITSVRIVGASEIVNGATIKIYGVR